MPYFGEVREFATGRVIAEMASLGAKHPKPPFIETTQHVWTGSEWAARGTYACAKVLQAIRDDKLAEAQAKLGFKHDPLAQPGALR